MELSDFFLASLFPFTLGLIPAYLGAKKEILNLFLAYSSVLSSGAFREPIRRTKVRSPKFEMVTRPESLVVAQLVFGVGATRRSQRKIHEQSHQTHCSRKTPTLAFRSA